MSWRETTVADSRNGTVRAICVFLALFVIGLAFSNFFSFATRAEVLPAGPIFEYPVPRSILIEAGPDGRIWFFEEVSVDGSVQLSLSVFTPPLNPSASTVLSFVSYQVPSLGGVGFGGFDFDSNGRIWFTNIEAQKLAVFDEATTTFQEFDVPSPPSNPTSVIVDSSDVVWFVEGFTPPFPVVNDIVSFSLSTLQFEEFRVPTVRPGLVDLALDSQGRIWFTEGEACKVGRFDPATETFLEFSIPVCGAIPGFIGGDPSFIAVDDDDDVWFIASASSRLGRLDGQTFAITEFPLPVFPGCPIFASGNTFTCSNPTDIAVDALGRIWFPATLSNKIVLFDPPSSTFTVFDIPTPGVPRAGQITTSPSSLTFDSHGNVWFTEPGADQLGVITRAVVVEVLVDIKPGSFPNSVNLGGRGKIPVAVLSTPDFDAATVDETSLTFGQTGAEDSLAKCSRSFEDVNGDGLLDLVCHFRTQDTDFEAGDTEGVLRGRTVNGIAIEGRDSIRIVP